MSTESHCPECKEVIQIRTNGGMGDDIVLRCNQCGIPGKVCGYDPRYQEMIRFEGGLKAALAALPNNLKPCSCGGHFSHDAPPRCPHCLAILSDEQLRRLANLPLSSINYNPYFMLKPTIEAQWVEDYVL